MDPRIRYFYRTWYRVPFLVPAWEWEEVRTALDPRRAPALGAVARLGQELDRRFGFSHVVLTSTGTFALELALRAIGRAGEVVIPTFICGSVAQAVVDAGCVPVLADVNDDLTISAECVEACLSDRTVAVVVAHLSGTPARDLHALVELCSRRNVPLIDDAAQALGGTVGGAQLGSFGQFGIVSFGLGKTTFSIGGGALVLRSARDAERCRAIAAQIDREQHTAPRRRDAWRFVLEYCWRQYTLPVFMGQRVIQRALGARALRPRRGAIDPLAAALQLQQLSKLDRILTGFRRHAEAVMHALGGRDGVVFPQAKAETTYSKLLVALECGHAREFATALLLRGVEVEWSYTPLHLMKEYASNPRRLNGVADTIWPRLVALPNHPRLSQDQAQYVGRAAADALAAVQAA